MSTSTATLGAGGIALVVLTIVCWFIQVVYLFGATGAQASGDAAFGQAFSWFAALLFAALTWLWTGGLLLKAGTQGMMPHWVAVTAAILYFASGCASAAALYLLAGSRQTWLVIVPAALPPIIAVYAVALYMPALRPALSGTIGSLAVWGIVLILALSPWPAFVGKIRAESAHRGARARGLEQFQVEQRARNRTENLVKLQAMTPDQPLVNWYPLLDDDSGVRTEALEALRRVDRRQTDIEEMLNYGIMRAMMLLPDLDLKATPQLCAAAQAYLLKTAKESRVRPKQDPRPYDGSSWVDPILPGIRWLVANRCDCDEGIAAFEAAVATYIESPPRNAAVGVLAGLRTKH